MDKQTGILVWAKDRDGLIQPFKDAVKMTEAGTVEVKIMPIKLTRTIAMNRLYWLWLEFIATHSGSDEPSIKIHEFYKKEFIPKFQIDVFGEQFEVQPSTSSLKVDEFSNYLKHVEKHANEFHCLELPQPIELVSKSQLEWSKKA